MRLCNYWVRLCNYEVVQLLGCATMRLCNYQVLLGCATMRLCNYKVVWTMALRLGTTVRFHTYEVAEI